MFFTHITDDCLIKIISRHLNRCIHNSAAQWDYRNIRSTSADIYNHIPTWLCNINSRANRGRYRLFNQVHFPRTCRISSLFYRFLFHFCDTTGHTDTNTRFFECSLTKRLSDKIFDHLFCHCIIRNHALPERTNRNDIPRRPSEHQSRFFPDRFDYIRISVKRDNWWFFQNDSFAADIDKHTGCSQIYSDIYRHIPFSLLNLYTLFPLTSPQKRKCLYLSPNRSYHSHISRPDDTPASNLHSLV